MLHLLLSFILAIPLLALDEPEKATHAPKYLYKITTSHNWVESQNKDELKLLPEDSTFIHLATEDQIGRILSKYWSGESEVVILKLETALLSGRLIYEKNPGGENKYYHLYMGIIPRKSVVEAEKLQRDASGAFVGY